MLFIRPDPSHSWYATFTTCQTLRMWTALFMKCTSESDRVLALRALVYFAQPPDKYELPRREEYTKEMAFRDLIKEEQQQGSRERTIGRCDWRSPRSTARRRRRR